MKMFSFYSRQGQRDRDHPQSPEFRSVGGLIQARARHSETLCPSVRGPKLHPNRSPPVGQALAPAASVRGRECSSRRVLRRLLQGLHQTFRERIIGKGQGGWW